MESVDDPKKLCRMCAQPYSTFFSLQNTHNPLLARGETLRIYTGVSVKENDDLSTRVCVNCFEQLEQCARVRIRVLEAQSVQLAHLHATTPVLLSHDNFARSGLKVRNSAIFDPATFTIPIIKTASVNLNTFPDIPIKMEPPEEEIDEEDMFDLDSDEDLLLHCGVCLQDFVPIKFKSHVCDLSIVSFCKKCPAKFLEDEELQQHITKEHAVKKPGRTPRQKGYQCVHCQEYFQDVEVLEDHLRRVGHQMANKIYSCDFCLKFFFNEEDNKNHMKEAHSLK